ncbi:hypothetical protein EKH55_5431 [Sinorhizobium alkalisoli]|nr:hypothetical protein EKH55_5431 [Sinorhizobium alkalisoli]
MLLSMHEPCQFRQPADYRGFSRDYRAEPNRARMFYKSALE